MKTYRNKLGLALVVLASLATAATAQTSIKPTNPSAVVTLAWDAEAPAAGIKEYILYYGTASRTYTVRLSAGLATELTVTLPSRGPTYWFAVTASDGVLESDYSNEVSYKPVLPPSPPVMHTVIVLTVQSKPLLDTKENWADAGMDWSLSPDQASQAYRLKISAVVP